MYIVAAPGHRPLVVAADIFRYAGCCVLEGNADNKGYNRGMLAVVAADFEGYAGCYGR